MTSGRRDRLLNLLMALAFVAFAVFVVWHATSYRLGTFARMGSGFYPLMLGIILAVLTAMNALATALGLPEPSEVRLRPLLFIPLGLLAFALVLPPFGLVPATFALVAIAALADRTARPLTMILTAAGLSALGILVFIHGLKVPLQAVRW